MATTTGSWTRVGATERRGEERRGEGRGGEERRGEERRGEERRGEERRGEERRGEERRGEERRGEERRGEERKEDREVAGCGDGCWRQETLGKQFKRKKDKKATRKSYKKTRPAPKNRTSLKNGISMITAKYISTNAVNY